jgi:acyl carrier protein
LHKTVQGAQIPRERHEIRQFLTDAFPLSDEIDDLEDGDSLLDTGVLDSMGVLELVAFLEERYQIEVPDEDLRPEYLDSVSRIVAYVRARRAARETSG